MTFYVLFAAVMGLIVGSFLNVCIYRVPRDLSVVTPRSFCPECGKQLPWFQNLPVVSYVLQQGRCRSCAQPIGLRYPLVELSTALLFSLTVALFGPQLAALKWGTFEALLIVLFWTDLEERILPDEVIFAGCAAALLFAFFVPVPGSLGQLILSNAAPRWASLFNAATGAVLLSLPVWLIGSLYGRIRKREALGLGDVKLLVMLGLFLGPEQGIKALLIGAVAGSVVGICYVSWTKQQAATYELPFGSFLCVGALLVTLIFVPGRSLLGVP